MATTELAVEPWLTGLKFPRGMRWHDGQLWFTDILARAVRVSVPGQAEARLLAEIPAKPAGLSFDLSGHLFVVSMDDCSVLRYGPSGFEPYADFSTQQWAMLTDMTVDPETGIAYVAARPAGQHKPGAVVTAQADGATAIAAIVEHPNGMTVIPGTRELVVADVNNEQLLSFEIHKGGTLSAAGIFATLPGRHPHGLCADAAGAVWTTAYLTGEVLRVERGGNITHRVGLAADRWALACTLGGEDWTSLFIASALTSPEKWGRGESDGWIDTAAAPSGV